MRLESQSVRECHPPERLTVHPKKPTQSVTDNFACHWLKGDHRAGSPVSWRPESPSLFNRAIGERRIHEHMPDAIVVRGEGKRAVE